MKVLFTVGTTPFDSLCKYLDNNLDKSTDITFQIAKAKYKPVNFPFIEYTDDINKLYNESDIIISHAGAGSIYNLLEKEKIIILVPNLERIDKHQNDIAKYMNENNYAISVNSFEEIENVLKNIQNIQIRKFEKTNFFKTEEIINLF